MQDFAELRRAMVDCQIRPSDVTRYPIIATMLEVAREDFVPAAKRSVAYVGNHIEIAPDRVVMEPRTFAKLIDAMDISSEDLVLNIGCGLGYSAAVLGRLGEAVIAVEDDPSRAQEATTNLTNADVMNVVVETASLNAGAPAHGPYDAVVFEGAIEALPQSIVDQVKLGGRVGAIFLSDAGGQARIGTRTDSGLTWRRAFDATAPLLPGFEDEKSFVF